MIQDIEPYRLENSYDAKREPKPCDRLLIFDEKGRIFLSSDESGEVLPKVCTENVIYLFSIGETAYFMPSDANFNADNLSGEFRSLREMRSDGRINLREQFASASGVHLYQWYRDSRFCGRCGAKTVHSETERAMICPECRNTVYPRIYPAVIVGVINGEKLLLTKYRRGYEHFAMIAGFVEFGETLEQCVEREVMEEVGLRVKNIRYYKSQPWGYAQDLLAGFFCEAEGDCTINMDSDELKLAGWYSREEVVLQPDSMSLTNEMMKKFRNGEI